MYKFYLLFGAILSGMAVAIGAFGAHALKKILIVNGKFEVFETAVRYQFYHSLALLFLGLLLFKGTENKWFVYAGNSFIAGVFIFSGSLFILSLTNVKMWGAVTPVGGVLFLTGWLFCVLGIMKL